MLNLLFYLLCLLLKPFEGVFIHDAIPVEVDDDFLGGGNLSLG